MNILLTGGTGFIGDQLVRQLIEKGHKVRILTREKEVEPPYYSWSKSSIDEKVFENLDGIIHLAGAPLLNPWTKSYKKEIIDSRVDTANLLFNKVKEFNIPLKFFVSAGGASYYGQNTSNQIFEEGDSPGNDFLAEVCVQWENAAFQFEQLGTRVVVIRTPMVLDRKADAYRKMKTPTQFGLGACLGSGKQWTTWIHLEDLCRIYSAAIENENYKGPINAVTNDQMTHKIFMDRLAHHLHTKIRLPNIPSALVKIGMGEKAVIILEGSRLSNLKLSQNHFTFKYPTLDKALNEIIAK
ncbi:TIGR01777 family oxidoreductase [Faecalibacter sp. LW9]|uniref:TIGR01777 family oxidoreductase n=1 Tax=Faecalibacter sp. LW9 TaxID=3103144 RepID=UPI002AFF09EA|nr:TIGR01777 family oxidoreductase [Faecalibacter sp. LW9]